MSGPLRNFSCLARPVPRKAFGRWDATTFAPAGPPINPGAAALDLGVSPGGTRLFTAGVDKLVHLSSLPDGRPVGEPLSSGSGVGLPTGWFSADGRVLLSAWNRGGALSGTFRLWDAADGRPLGTPQDFGFRAEAAALQPQGKSFLATLRGPFSPACTARLWDGATNQPRGPEAPFQIRGAAFHPSVRFLALGGAEADARLWSAEVFKPIGPPLPHPGPVDVTFCPDGALVATHSYFDNTIRLWKIPEPLAGTPDQVRQRMEALTGQELDEAGGVHDLAPAEREERRRLADG